MNNITLTDLRNAIYRAICLYKIANNAFDLLIGQVRAIYDDLPLDSRAKLFIGEWLDDTKEENIVRYHDLVLFWLGLCAAEELKK